MSPEQHVMLDTGIANGDANAEQPREKPQNHLYVHKKRIMRFRRYNEDNEIERILMHNSTKQRLIIDHCDFPAFNQGSWPQANQDNLKTYPSCAFSVPRPIHVAEGQLQKMDVCYKRTHNRDLFKTRMVKTRTLHQAFLNSKKHKLGKKDGLVHKAVFDFAERLHSQPDPYFRGSYDYFYSGGNLCTLSQGGNVVHISGERLQTIEISDHNSGGNYLTSIASLTTKENSEIFEIKPIATTPDMLHRNFFIARQRNMISINCLNKDSQLKVITQFRTKSTPFISFAQSQRDCNKMLLTTMKQHVRVYDIGNNGPRLVKLFEIKPETVDIPWNMIRPWRENTYLFANKCKISFVDIRTTPDQWMDKAIFAIENNFDCDHISAIAPSEFNNLFYVATNHRLHCMDVRFMKKNSFLDPAAVVCRWSHQLQFAPLMIDIFRLQNSEYIALSSPLAGDMHVCQLNREKHNESLFINETEIVKKHIYRSPCLPYQPPTMLEAIEHSKFVRKCINPEARLQERVKACTTGLSFSEITEADSDLSLAELLTSNSLGDIFAHTLTKREGDEADSRGNARSNEIMGDYAQKLVGKVVALNYSEIRNMKGLRKVFLCNKLNTEFKSNEDVMDDSFSETETPAHQNAFPLRITPVQNKRKRLHMGRWQKSFATLSSYKDALVSDLLSIWDIEVDEEFNISGLNKIPMNINTKSEPSEKVRDWLDTNLSSDQPMIRIPSHIATNYKNQSITQTPHQMQRLNLSINENNNVLNYSDINFAQISGDFENAIQSTQIMENSFQLETAMETRLQDLPSTSMQEFKPKKKTKKYVKGF